MSGDAPNASRPGSSRSAAQRRIDRWTDGYTPLPGIPDEFMGADGQPRPQWMRFLGALSRLDQDEISRRFDAADRHIRDMGVSHRVYGETRERTWPLSHVPLLIEESEWRDIAAGVVQRARLMEHILADIYGPGDLIKDGLLPAAAVTGSPDYLRPMAGVKPPGGRWLHLYAVDIGRGPDGRWWVLGDRGQAPSGSGYALQSRLVASRAFPQLYSEMNVERLAPFFRSYRDGLTAAASRSEPRICLLTPGPYSETYFEQSYLARYLGFLLVEGDDLIVSDGKVHVRTIAGLKRADVIWRRIDGDYSDPLEMNAASRLGIPGVVEALRNGEVAMANMPGTGVIESKALLGFLPSIVRHAFGEPLLLPNIATWWCGQKSARDEMLANLDNMAISGAFGDSLPGFPGKRMLLGSNLSSEEKARVREALGVRGVDYVGQEIVRLSTTPVWEDGRLAPRPFALRVFAAATPNGWEVMPGGFCRISDRADARAVSMSEGAKSADVWVLSEKPVEMSTLLPTNESVKIRRLLGNLPSRAADNLFWLGRYLERVEATLRLIRCLCNRGVEIDTAAPQNRQSIDRLQRMLTAWGAAPASMVGASPAKISVTALYSRNHYGSALSIATSSMRAASVIRERLSTDTWRLVNELEDRLTAEADAVLTEPECYDRADDALRLLAALSGFIKENVNRVAGWRFLDTGRRIERGVNTCRFARQFADKDATADNLDVLLDLIDSQITYRSRYLIGVALAPVRDMVVLDTFNPRSVAFQVERVDEHLATLPVLREDGMLETPRRASMRLLSELSTEDAAQLDTQKILAFEQRIMGLADSVAERYFLQGRQSARIEKLADLA